MTSTQLLPQAAPLAAGTSRLQLALNVTDLDAAIDFYERLFATPVTKKRAGYANFAIANPPLKLVLMEGEQGASLNHLGVEVPSSLDVADATARLDDSGLATAEEEGVTCCHALQDKVWVTDPDGAPWEVYAVLADADVDVDADARSSTANAGCGPGCC